MKINPARVAKLDPYYTEEEIRDMIYHDVWCFFQNYLAQKTGILPMPIVSEAESKTLQGAVDVLTDIVLDCIDLND